MGVQPLSSAWSGIYPHGELSLTDIRHTYTIFVVIIGVFSFEMGYCRWKLDVNKKPVNTDQKLKYQYISLVNLWIAILAVTSIVIMSVLIYGLNIFLSLRDGIAFNDSQGAEMSRTEAQLVINGIRALAAVLLFISLYKMKIEKLKNSHKKRKFILLAVIFLIFLNLFVSNPLNAPRLWSGSVFLTSLFILLKWNNSISYRRWAIGACLSLLLLFSGTDPRRIFSQTLVKGEEVTLDNTLKSISEGISSLPYDSNFDAFQIVSYTTLYTAEKGYSWGYQTLLPIFFWVPRSLWPGKPIGTSDVVGEFAGFYSINVSSPLWTEGYINFGLIGVILFLYFFGRAARVCDHYLSSLTIKSAFQTIISSYFAANTLILLRGDLTSGTMYLQMIIVFSLIFLFFFRKEIDLSDKTI
jgi:oligosaccharide repeat unit polymerase